MSRRWVRDWIEVRADEVQEGDLYANHATVTESRPYDEDRDVGWGRSTTVEWIVRCGPDFASGGKRDRRIVVGRNARLDAIATPTGGDS